MKLVLIGIPGAGKSTQGNLLSKIFKIPYLSTGHIFRQIAQEKTPTGREVKAIVNSGQLIPDTKTIPIVEDYLSRPEYRKGYILDGFPRTLDQARRFKGIIDKVIYLHLSDKEALWRLAYRNDALRSDDTVQTIRKRIDIFHQTTKPVVDYYLERNMLLNIDASPDVEIINKGIINILTKKRSRKKTIVAIVGLPGCGKSEAARFFSEKKIPIVYFGKIVNDIIKSQKKRHLPENHNTIIKELRQKNGMEALARLNEEKIAESLADSNTLVIDGLRSWEEYVYLQKKFANIQIVLVGIYADKELRDRRIKKRTERNELFGRDRDINELINTNVGPTFAYADYFIDNNGGADDFRNQLEKLFQKLNFNL